MHIDLVKGLVKISECGKRFVITHRESDGEFYSVPEWKIFVKTVYWVMFKSIDTNDVYIL